MNRGPAGSDAASPAPSLLVHDEHAARRLKVLQSTSASAIDRWEQCPRQWFGGYVEGIWAPQTPAQARGTAIDLEVQRHYRGEPVAEGWAEAVRGIVRLLPPRPLIQRRIEMPTYEGGPLLGGYPDFLYETSPGDALVLDLKSLSDFKYAKVADELRINTQIVTYSEWLWTLPGVRTVRAGHVAARFKKDDEHPVGYAFAGARLSDIVEMPRMHVAAQWAERLPLVRQMVEAARSTARFEDLLPLGASNVDEYGKTSCQRFGGCHFRGRCGFMKIGEDMSNQQGPGLMEQLMAAAGNAAGGGNGQPQQQQGAPWPNQAQSAGAPGYGPPPQMIPVNLNPPNGGNVPPGAYPQAPQSGPSAHPGAIGIPGYQPRQLCNGRGFYASANGQGFVDVEPGHMCPACVGPQAVHPGQPLPPDAPPRTSTPEEIKAVAEGKAKRGKKKTESSQEGVIEIYTKLGAAGYTADQVGKLIRSGQHEAILAKLAQPDPVPMLPPSPLLPPAPAAPPPAAAPTPNQQAQDSWYQNSGPPLARPEEAPKAQPQQQPPVVSMLPGEIMKTDPGDGTRGFAPTPLGFGRDGSIMLSPPAQARRLALYVDCLPSKGALATPLADWLAPLDAAARAAVVDDNGRPSPTHDLRLVPYGRGKGYLATAIRAAAQAGQVPEALAIDSLHHGADVALECLTPWATLVVRGRP